MKVLVALSALLVVASGQYWPYGSPYASNWNWGGYYNNYAPVTYAAATYAAPATTYAAAPVQYAAATPYAAVSSQYHSQDELGQFNYGYSDGLSTKNEYRRFDGATVGSYSYVDANGKVQTVSYTADDVNGFQVKATNLPVAPVANLEAPVNNLVAPVFDGVAPEPVQDTPEVAAAKVEFRKAYAEAAAAAEAAPDADAPVERRRRSLLIPTVAEATFKTASLDTVEADTPADTTLLEVTEKEHKAIVPGPYAYATPTYYHHAAPIVTYAAPKVEKVEVKTVAAPAFTYAATPYHFATPLTYVAPKVEKVEAKTVAAPAPFVYNAPTFYHHAPATVYAAPKVTIKQAEVKHVVNPFAYHAYPYGFNYGVPFITNVEEKKEAEAEEEAPAVEVKDRRRRSLLIPTVAKATVKYATLDKVEADTPADTTLLKINEKEKEVVVPGPYAYAAPTYYHHAAPIVTYAAPKVEKVEVKTVAAPAPFVYNAPTFYHHAPTTVYAAPKVTIKQAEVKHVVNPFAYHAYPYGFNYGVPFITNVEEKKEAEAEEETPAVEVKDRRRRSLLIPTLAKATVKYATLDKVEADTPADTTLLKINEKEKEVVVPGPYAYAAPTYYHHAAPIVTYAAPKVEKVEVKTVAAPAPFVYNAPTFYHHAAPIVTYAAPKVEKVEVKTVAAPAPFVYNAPTFYHHAAPIVTYAAPKVEKVEVKTVAAPAVFPYAAHAYPNFYGNPLIYNIAPKAAEEKAE